MANEPRGFLVMVGSALEERYSEPCEDFETILCCDLRTALPDHTDILELAVVRCRLSDLSIGYDSYSFRPERQNAMNTWRRDRLPSFTEGHDTVLGSMKYSGIVVVHDPSTAHVMKLRMPGWQPDVVISTEHLARMVYPRQDGYGLEHLLRCRGMTDEQRIFDPMTECHEDLPTASCRNAIGIAALFVDVLGAAAARGFHADDVRVAGGIRLIEIED